MRGPVTGDFQIPVRTVLPRHTTSLGMPTFTDTSVAVTASTVNQRLSIPDVSLPSASDEDEAEGQQDRTEVGQPAGAGVRQFRAAALARRRSRCGRGSGGE